MKRLCVLQVAPSNPNKDHVSYFKDKENCDFYFVTHDDDNPEALKYCPNTRWAETRNTLAELVPKEYDYYAFVDYDYILRPQRDLEPLEQIIEDLEMNPAVLTYYPGNNLQTPYASDKEYFNSRDYSCIPFTHAGLKVVHHSLMKWFFPLCTNFSVDIDSCHMFNIQEIPFLKNIVCSHKMIYDNGNSDEEATYNKDGAYSKYKMDEMWKWIQPSFKMNKIINFYAGTQQQCNDSLMIKRAFVDIVKKKNTTPARSPSDIDYYCHSKISKVFDLDHEYFINKTLNVEAQFEKLEGDFKTSVENILRRDVSFDSLRTRNNPWINIVKNINNELYNHRNITINECVEVFQKMDNNQSLFIYNAKTNPALREYLRDKRVAFVGPAPYLTGLGKGKHIDSFDVVIRVQPEIWDVNDYGSRTDIVQSCLNSTYSPKVAKFLQLTPVSEHPKFIICNDTVARETVAGNKQWLSTVKEYDDYLRQYNVPLAHLQNEDGSWERWALYWEVYAKQHIERVDEGLYTHYSGNFNSGYGALNMVMSCPLKELHVFGVNFYNFGVVRGMKDKYNPAYIKAQGKDGTYLGPDKLLHDQMSQIMHCKNVLDRDPRFKLDEQIRTGLHEESLAKRIDKFKKLPKILQTTE